MVIFFQIKHLTPDEAAVQAIHLFSQEARLCERHPNKLARTNEEQLLSEEEVKDNEESIRAAEEVMSSTRPRKDISLPLSLDGSNTKTKSTRKSSCRISEFWWCFYLFVFSLFLHFKMILS